MDGSDAAEYAPQIIHSMLTGTPREIHVNTVNRGLISNLPEGAVVEVPASVSAATASSRSRSGRSRRRVPRSTAPTSLSPSSPSRRR